VTGAAYYGDRSSLVVCAQAVKDVRRVNGPGARPQNGFTVRPSRIAGFCDGKMCEPPASTIEVYSRSAAGSPPTWIQKSIQVREERDRRALVKQRQVVRVEPGAVDLAVHIAPRVERSRVVVSRAAPALNGS
jgi:hypothetical protein